MLCVCDPGGLTVANPTRRWTGCWAAICAGLPASLWGPLDPPSSLHLECVLYIYTHCGEKGIRKKEGDSLLPQENVDLNEKSHSNLSEVIGNQGVWLEAAGPSERCSAENSLSLSRSTAHSLSVQGGTPSSACHFALVSWPSNTLKNYWRQHRTFGYVGYIYYYLPY